MTTTRTLTAVGISVVRSSYRTDYRTGGVRDLAEEFRPLIGDSVVLTLVNNGEVTPSSFIRRAGGVTLTDAGRRAVIAAFERRIDQPDRAVPADPPVSLLADVALREVRWREAPRNLSQPQPVVVQDITKGGWLKCTSMTLLDKDLSQRLS